MLEWIKFVVCSVIVSDDDSDDDNDGVVWVGLLCDFGPLNDFGMWLMSIMWAYLWPYNCVLKVGSREPKKLSISCGELYCVNVWDILEGFRSRSVLG